MVNIKNDLLNICKSVGVDITSEQCDKFQIYYEMLLDYNSRINLTSITESDKIIEKHFLDSILILKYIEINDGDKLADVGTGAGFPGIPLKIMRPDIDLTLMDSLNKRIVFLEDLCDNIGIDVDAVHIRAEQAGQDPVFRRSFDIVTARAVAKMSVLSEYCIPLLKEKGVFLAMKGPSVEEELNLAKSAISVLGGKVRKVEDFNLPCGDERRLVIIDKVAKTPFKYPRNSGLISKNPI